MKPGICIHCRRHRDNHKALTLHCPVGLRTRVGYIHFHDTQVFEERREWTTFMPKFPVCEWQCQSCPFRRGQKIAHRKGLAEIRQKVQQGLPFFCHKTVYRGDPLLAAHATENGDTSRMRPQSDWRECRGALRYRERENLKRAKSNLTRDT